MSAEPVWVLLGPHVGDNNQLLRLAGELGLPFRTIELRYNPIHLLQPELLGPTLASLDRDSASRIQPPWPRLVLGSGHRSVPIALAIRDLSGGSARLVRLGNPRFDPAAFDLVVTTPQYRVVDAPNVIRLETAIGTAPKVEPAREEAQWLDKLQRPHRLLLIGGGTFMWKLEPLFLDAAASTLRAKPGGSVVAVSSGRTDPAAMTAVAKALRGSEHGLVWGRFPRYPVVLNDADEIYVTADSVAMVSDAIATGKPVGLVLPTKTLAGRLFYALEKLGISVPVRDVRRFWSHAARQRFAGTIDDPVASDVGTHSLDKAVSTVRGLLET
ncbi:MAG TPA: ELM1/GtrOC1 family putative glycosyltransferase [Sphingomicrobium sp.]|nr:ELM1/GtrOC1 family putative glycosyltransferase [Sphingomicrobium sp.]